MFAGGVFSADPLDPLQADAGILANISVADLERGGFEVHDVEGWREHCGEPRSLKLR